MPETTQSNNAAYVGVGKPKVGGAIFIAPTGTDLPSDASSDLDDAFKLLGYVSEDGVTLASENDNDNILAWGGDAVYTTQTSFTETVTFTPIEVNPVVAKAEYGDENVTISNGLMTVKHTASELDEKILVIETIPNKNTTARFVAPRAKLTEKGDQTLNDSDPMGRECTFTCLPDSSGVTIYEYIANSSFTEADTGGGGEEEEDEHTQEASQVDAATVGEAEIA